MSVDTRGNVKLAAGASDVRYEEETARGTIRRITLSQYHSTDSLQELFAFFRRFKPDGGAIYINEGREIFAPVQHGGAYERIYIGHLRSRPWFPEPTL